MSRFLGKKIKCGELGENRRDSGVVAVYSVRSGKLKRFETHQGRAIKSRKVRK